MLKTLHTLTGNVDSYVLVSLERRLKGFSEEINCISEHFIVWIFKRISLCQILILEIESLAGIPNMYTENTL